MDACIDFRAPDLGMLRDILCVSSNNAKLSLKAVRLSGSRFALSLNNTAAIIIEFGDALGVIDCIDYAKEETSVNT